MTQHKMYGCMEGWMDAGIDEWMDGKMVNM